MTDLIDYITSHIDTIIALLGAGTGIYALYSQRKLKSAETAKVTAESSKVEAESSKVEAEAADQITDTVLKLMETQDVKLQDMAEELKVVQSDLTRERRARHKDKADRDRLYIELAETRVECRREKEKWEVERTLWESEREKWEDERIAMILQIDKLRKLVNGANNDSSKS